MNYEQYINQVLDLREAITIQENNILDLEAKCNNCTTPFSERVQGTLKNTRELNLVRYADAQRELETMYQQLDDLSKDLIRFITKNLARQDSTIMVYKYVQGKENKEIAKIKYMAEGSVRNVLCRANRRLRTKYDKQGFSL